MLRIWEGSIADVNLVSRGGAHTQDDEDDYNGSSGEVKEKKLVLAPAQTELAAEIDAAIEIITLTAPVFDDPNHPVKIIDDEKVFVTSGFGTNTVAVIREWGGTTGAIHAKGVKIYDCYTYENITIQASGDETSWFRYAPDVAGSPGTYGASLNPANFTNPKADFYKFWREITAPEIAAQRKRDTRHKVKFEPFEYAA